MFEEHSLRERAEDICESKREYSRIISGEFPFHEGIGQYIAGLSLAIGRLRIGYIDEADSNSRQTLSECRTLIQKASQEIRSISYLLHPPIIDQLGLKSALQRVVDSYGERRG